MRSHPVLPHTPCQVAAGSRGEDAWFSSQAGCGAVGVADGVGGWGLEGIDSAAYALQLMDRCAHALEGPNPCGSALAALEYAQVGGQLVEGGCMGERQRGVRLCLLGCVLGASRYIARCRGWVHGLRQLRMSSVPGLAAAYSCAAPFLVLAVSPLSHALPLPHRRQATTKLPGSSTACLAALRPWPPPRPCSICCCP